MGQHLVLVRTFAASNDEAMDLAYDWAQNYESNAEYSAIAVLDIKNDVLMDNSHIQDKVFTDLIPLVNSVDKMNKWFNRFVPKRGDGEKLYKDTKQKLIKELNKGIDRASYNSLMQLADEIHHAKILKECSTDEPLDVSNPDQLFLYGTFDSPMPSLNNDLMVDEGKEPTHVVMLVATYDCYTNSFVPK